MQWRMLGRRGRHASWTIVGDEAQSSWPHPSVRCRAQGRARGQARACLPAVDQLPQLRRDLRWPPRSRRSRCPTQIWPTRCAAPESRPSVSSSPVPT
ncbi:hypothetical protein [Aeromicrobium sp. UC242_57]|uniref:hypothetical protein n=1 Tax=Aeromicrobium sp. UC242_57 TaxID=3374624 RepID=UPI00378EBD72